MPARLPWSPSREFEVGVHGGELKAITVPDAVASIREARKSCSVGTAGPSHAFDRPAAIRRPMKIAVLHLGDPRGGVQRYGRVLAGALRHVGDVEVTEHTADLRLGGPRAVPAALRAANALAGADVCVVPYGRHGLWAAGRVRVPQLLVLLARLRRKTVMVLHDVAEPGAAGVIEEICLRLIAVTSGAMVVHGQHERARMSARGLGGRVVQVPHFVERRALPDRDEARHALGLTPDDVAIGMVGWIHPRKNCEAAVDAMALLAPNTRLSLIGAPSSGADGYMERLLQRAATRGVRDRVEATGYVSEEDLNLRLAALDVGLCPYLDASASASFATLLSAHVPIIATDLPAFRSFSGGTPDVTFVDEPTPELLSRAIRRQLLGASGTSAAGTSNTYSPQSVAQVYVDTVFRSVCRRVDRR